LGLFYFVKIRRFYFLSFINFSSINFISSICFHPPKILRGFAKWHMSRFSNQGWKRWNNNPKPIESRQMVTRIKIKADFGLMGFIA
jgi:hypothetical protein